MSEYDYTETQEVEALLNQPPHDDTIHHGTWSHRRDERCLECEQVAAAEHEHCWHRSQTQPCCDYCCHCVGEQCPSTTCQWCAQGDVPKLLDEDGTLVSITGKQGTLCHAHEECWWPCLRYGAELRTAQRTPPTQPAPDAGGKDNDYFSPSNFCLGCTKREGTGAKIFHAPPLHDLYQPALRTEWGLHRNKRDIITGDGLHYVAMATSEEHATQIVADHNAVPKLVAALRDLLDTVTEMQDGGAVTFSEDKQRIRIADDLVRNLTTTPRDRGGE